MECVEEFINFEYIDSDVFRWQNQQKRLQIILMNG